LAIAPFRLVPRVVQRISILDRDRKTLHTPHGSGRAAQQNYGANFSG
jgi:hypothetical protein